MYIHRHASSVKIRALAIIFLFIISVVIILATAWLWYTDERTAQITTEEIASGEGDGVVIKGKNTGEKGTLTTTYGSVTFQSKEMKPRSATANAIVINWVDTLNSQNVTDEQAAGAVDIYARTKERDNWSKWVKVSDVKEDRKDGTTALNKALVIASTIDEFQYRVQVTAGQSATPVVELEKTKLQVIDSSKGPSMNNEANMIQKVIGSLLPFNNVSAKADGPRIIQREEWGGWENPSIGWYPKASPRWPEQYEPLKQIIVHHTATTANGDSYAAMRAIWQFHANNNDWGDIGYNYVVDPWGNVFKGRHYVEADSKQQKGEVVAGHTYGHNRGTIGISVLGDYTTQTPTADSIYSVSKIAAFKAVPYGFNPSESSNLIGHRDATSTSCPGTNLYPRLPEIRRLSDTYYTYYINMDRFDASYQGQGSYAVMWPNTESLAYLDIKNEGTNTWVNNELGSITLVSDRPKGRMSSICATGWIDCSRVGSFNEKVINNQDGSRSAVPATSIAPGEIGRFNFKIRAPNSGGAFREHFSFRINNGSDLIRDLGVYYDLSVPNPTYSWKLRDQSIFTDSSRTQIINPKDLLPNTTYYARIKAYNAGNQTWYRDGKNPVRLATNSPADRRSIICDSSWIYTDCNRPAVLKETAVEPMSEGTFEFSFKTPINSGEYREHFNVMVERLHPMSGENQYWDFKLKQ